MKKEIAIKTAAKWWTDKLRQRTPHDNGDNSPASVFACIFADMATDEVTEDKLAVFTAELEHQIQEHMENINDRYVCLDCDYAPCTLLRESADAAGINRINFPFKTDMAIEQNSDNGYRVRVSDGYAQPWADLPACE